MEQLNNKSIYIYSLALMCRAFLNAEKESEVRRYYGKKENTNHRR